MCGRGCCSLSADAITSAVNCLPCKRLKPTLATPDKDREVTPAADNIRTIKWQQRALNLWKPSFNKTPKQWIPVLRFAKDGSTLEITTMQWGLVPNWYPKTKSASDFKLTMFNARAETVLSKASFCKPLEEGRRCIVMLEGYYEWCEDGSADPSIPSSLSVNDPKKPIRQPYYVYPRDHYIGGNLLLLAGLWDCWGDNDLETFTIITEAAENTIHWMHDRQPAIFSSLRQIDAWLDPSVSGREALNLLDSKAGAESLNWHPVSNKVGNIKNNGPDLRNKHIIKPPPPAGSSNLMMNWIKTSSSPKRVQQEATQHVTRKGRQTRDRSSKLHEHTDQEQITIENIEDATPQIQCVICTLLNKSSAIVCEACGGSLSLEKQRKSCPVCTLLNDCDVETCAACGNAFGEGEARAAKKLRFD